MDTSATFKTVKNKNSCDMACVKSNKNNISYNARPPRKKQPVWNNNEPACWLCWGVSIVYLYYPSTLMRGLKAPLQLSESRLNQSRCPRARAPLFAQILHVNCLMSPVTPAEIPEWSFKLLLKALGRCAPRWWRHFETYNKELRTTLKFGFEIKTQYYNLHIIIL